MLVGYNSSSIDRNIYEGLSSPNIHTPHNMAEFASIIMHYPEAELWAGGTFLMTRPDSYPSKKMGREIISLASMEELHRFQRNDRFAEFGAMVTLDEVMSTGKAVLPKVLLDNIRSIGSRLITRKATIGGAIAAREISTSFPGTLISLDATAEVRFIKKKRLHSRWIQLTRMLDKNGKISIPSGGMISRIRISFSDKDCQSFSSIGSVLTAPDETVAIAFTAALDQDVLNNPTIAFTYPNIGIVYSRDIDNVFSSLRLPIDETEFRSLEQIIFTFIDSSVQNLSKLQRTRTSGILRSIIDSLNEKSLTSPAS